jgi:hypothetical protein
VCEVISDHAVQFFKAVKIVHTYIICSIHNHYTRVCNIPGNKIAQIFDIFVILDCCIPSLSSWWSGVEQGPPDTIFGLVEAHKKDPRPNKVSVVIGAYRDGQGKP